MKKSIVWILLPLLLYGCASDSNELTTAMELRTKILRSSECSFTAEVTADYEDRSFQYTADCVTDKTGNLTFVLTGPATVAGISGTLTGEGGQLTFDDMALEFPLSAEDLPSPISAPWIFMKALRGGYLASAWKEEGNIALSVDDTCLGEDLRLDIRLDSENLPDRAEILRDGIRILTLNVTKFAVS